MNYWGLSFIVINHCLDGLLNHLSLSSSFHICLMLGFRELRFVILFSLTLAWWLPDGIGTLGQWQGFVQIESISRHLTAVFVNGGEQVYTEDYLTNLNFGETWTKVVHVYNFIPINYSNVLTNLCSPFNSDTFW